MERARRGAVLAISGEVIIEKLVDASRKVEMEMLKKYGVYEKVPIEECLEETGKGLVGVKLVDVNKGDKDNPGVPMQIWREGDQ